MKKKIVFVISALDLGGAQKVLCHLVEYLSARDYLIKVVSLYSDKPGDFFQISRYADVSYLDLERISSGVLSGIINNLKRIKVLRGVVFKNNPDLVISFLNRTNVLTLLAGARKNAPIIVTEHTDAKVGEPSKVWRSLRDWSYRFATKLVVLTEESYSYYSKIGNIDIEVIPNPVKECPFSRQKETVTPTLVSVGRLSNEKGHDLLLKAFQMVSQNFPAWELHIIGDGPLLDELTLLAKSLGIDKKVKFMGAVTNIYEYLSRADIFVLFSRCEGFPMALCEAMACGLACVAADCPTGPREIIRDGCNGLLVSPENIEQMALTLTRLMSDPEERDALGQEAKNITRRFGMKVVMQRWEDMFDRICAK